MYVVKRPRPLAVSFTQETRKWKSTHSHGPVGATGPKKTATRQNDAVITKEETSYSRRGGKKKNTLIVNSLFSLSRCA